VDLNSREEDLVDREKRLMEREKQPTERHLQIARPDRGCTGVSWLQPPPHLGDPVEEVSAILSLLDSVRAKMLKLEEVIDGQLKVEGSTLANGMAEYVLTCS
jgi:hypothetical protein